MAGTDVDRKPGVTALVRHAAAVLAAERFLIGMIAAVLVASLARGNVAASIFNATLSILLGVFLTPLLVTLLVGHASGGLSLGDAVLSIGAKLLLPFAAGQALRPLAGAWLVRWKPWTNVVDRAVIVLLVFVAFSDSVADGLWSRHGAGPARRGHLARPVWPCFRIRTFIPASTTPGISVVVTSVGTTGSAAAVQRVVVIGSRCLTTPCCGGSL